MNRALFAALLALSALAAFNPGIVARVHKHHLTEIIKVMIPIANPFLKSIVSEELVDVGVLKLLKTNITIEDIKPARVTCPKTDQSDFLECEILDSNFHLFANAEIKAFVFKSLGTIHADGKINVIKARFGFMNFDDKQHGKPYLNLMLNDIIFDAKSLKVHLDFKNIPSTLIDTIISLFKSALVKNIREQLMKFFNQKGNALVNKIIEQKFPETVEIKPLGIALRTEVPKKPTIDSHDVALGVDGTFYDIAKGYKRDKDAPKVEGEAMEAYFGDVSLTSYTLRTLFESIRGKSIIFEAQGLKLTFTHTGEPTFGICKDGLSGDNVVGKLRVQKGNYWIELSLDVSGLVWLGVHKSIDFFLDIDVKKLTFKRFEVKSNIPGVETLGIVVHMAIEQLLKRFHKFSIDLPNVILPFDLKVTDLGMQLSEDLLQVGGSVQIDHLARELGALFERFVKEERESQTSAAVF